MSQKKEKIYAKLRIYYKNHDDKTLSSVVDFKKDVNFATGTSRKENLEEALFEVTDSRGAWVSNKLFIPYHRILAAEVIDFKPPEEEKQEEVKKAEKSEKAEKQKPQRYNNKPNVTKNKRRVRKGNSNRNKNNESQNKTK